MARKASSPCRTRTSSRATCASGADTASGRAFPICLAALRRRAATVCTRWSRHCMRTVPTVPRASSRCTSSRRRRPCSAPPRRGAQSRSRRALTRRRLILGCAVVAAGAAALAAVLVPRGADAYVVRPLVSDAGLSATTHDAALVNAWGLAASRTGPWWTAKEARDRSTLYAADGKKQALTVVVEGGPTGVAYNGGRGFLVQGGGVSAPARFIYACEDGKLRGWAPDVPRNWSRTAEIVADESLAGAVFRGVAIATLPGGTQRLYATEFHNARVDVYDARWRRIRRPGAFADASIPAWYAPFGIHATGGRVFVTYASRAPVNGNDSPTGGYVDEFDLDGRLVARVGRMGPLNEPWGVALAPPGTGRIAGRLFVGNFGSGRIDVYARRAGAWSYRGQLRHAGRAPVIVNGLWGIAFGNGGVAGPKGTPFFAPGPPPRPGSPGAPGPRPFGLSRPPARENR